MRDVEIDRCLIVKFMLIRCSSVQLDYILPMHSMASDVLGYLLWEQVGVGDRSCCLVWLITMFGCC